MHTPRLRDTAGQCAGGTHPTGMHSCVMMKAHPSTQNDALFPIREGQ